METFIEAVRPYLELGLGGTAVILLYQFKGEVKAGFEAVSHRLDRQDDRIAALEQAAGRFLTNEPQSAV